MPFDIAILQLPPQARGAFSLTLPHRRRYTLQSRKLRHSTLMQNNKAIIKETEADQALRESGQTNMELLLEACTTSILGYDSINDNAYSNNEAILKEKDNLPDITLPPYLSDTQFLPLLPRTLTELKLYSTIHNYIGRENLVPFLQNLDDLGTLLSLKTNDNYGDFYLVNASVLDYLLLSSNRSFTLIDSLNQYKSCRLMSLFDASVPFSLPIDEKLLSSFLKFPYWSFKYCAPVAAAVTSNRIESLQLLLKEERLDPNTGCPLTIAVRLRLKEAFFILMRSNRISPNRGYPLFFATILNEAEMVQSLLEHPKTMVNRFAPGYGMTPLIGAIRYRCYETFHLLMACRRVDINRGFSLTPLQVAVCCGDIECASALLKHPNIDPDRKISGSAITSTILLAIESGNHEIIRLLLSDGRASIPDHLVNDLEAQNNLDILELLINSKVYQSAKDDSMTTFFGMRVGTLWGTRYFLTVLFILTIILTDTFELVRFLIWHNRGWPLAMISLYIEVFSVIVVAITIFTILFRRDRQESSPDGSNPVTINTSGVVSSYNTNNPFLSGRNIQNTIFSTPASLSMGCSNRMRALPQAPLDSAPSSPLRLPHSNRYMRFLCFRCYCFYKKSLFMPTSTNWQRFAALAQSYRIGLSPSAKRMKGLLGLPFFLILLLSILPFLPAVEVLIGYIILSGIFKQQRFDLHSRDAHYYLLSLLGLSRALCNCIPRFLFNVASALSNNNQSSSKGDDFVRVLGIASSYKNTTQPDGKVRKLQEWTHSDTLLCAFSSLCNIICFILIILLRRFTAAPFVKRPHHHHRHHHHHHHHHHHYHYHYQRHSDRCKTIIDDDKLLYPQVEVSHYL